jgi:chromosome segregation ATPase
MRGPWPGSISAKLDYRSSLNQLSGLLRLVLEGLLNRAIIDTSMSEETTRELPDRFSFEQGVLARFDSIDERLERLESRSYDTKPIWERALQQIMETHVEVSELKSRVEGIDSKVKGIESTVGGVQSIIEGIRSKVEGIETAVEGIGSKAEGIETAVEGIGSIVGRIETTVEVIDKRMENLQGDVTGLRNDYGSLHNELVESQRDFKVKLMRRIDLVLEVMVDNHSGLREADARLTRLESKLA